ncbi:S-adenosyl-L-methionine-dependent methyltransferase [Chaetomium sp. MPI-CAGE-AT-0009]|nr:S-adenosyl-L-methionine-dependent methyltransferase [Chaetomium sp. MPI-CAGE-AT-0009]
MASSQEIAPINPPANPPAAPQLPTNGNRSAAEAGSPSSNGIPEFDDDAGQDNAAGPNQNGNGSESMSSSSGVSISEFREEYGRTYHGYPAEDGSPNIDGYKPYFMPVDMTEYQRLNHQHDLVKSTQQYKLYLCPAGADAPVVNVLDAGCAEEHPLATVTGVDISPWQPAHKPPNAQFYVHDLDMDWDYDDPFDLIYARFLAGSITNWPKFFRQSYQNLRPGGWLEMCDFVHPISSFDDTIPADSALLEWNLNLVDASQRLGVDLTCGGGDYWDGMIGAGFENITRLEDKWPLGFWPEDPRERYIGRRALGNLIESLHGLTLMLFTRVLGWSAEDATDLYHRVSHDLRNPNIHAHLCLVVVFGQKPVMEQAST